MLKNFKITKLFGFRTVDISFDENIKILIGENGLGKTTVLNSIYYVLSQKYNKLSKIDFEEIELKFKNGKEVSFSKLELNNYLDFQRKPIRRSRLPTSLLRDINLSYLRENMLSNEASDTFETDTKKFIENYISKNTQHKPHPILISEIYRLITEYKDEDNAIFSKFKILNKIVEELNFSILYFPTYRRVEEDLKNLDSNIRKIQKILPDGNVYYEEIEEDADIDIGDDTLIHFGMEDVERRIRNVENEINKLTISGFSKLTGEMLSQLLKGFPNIEDKAISELDENTVKIILHRVGESLPEIDRNTIIGLLENKEDLKEKKELVYFIYKLIDIYEQHKHLDDAVKNFKDTCNKYLSDKYFYYNESSVTIEIYRNNTKETVSLSKLSSGEKQIVSLFSKIYLESNKNIIVLFDEPELSLSIEWQKQLLPDVLESHKCDFLLSVTHSPFIFKNDLEKYAIGMSVYVTEED